MAFQTNGGRGRGRGRVLTQGQADLGMPLMAGVPILPGAPTMQSVPIVQSAQIMEGAPIIQVAPIMQGATMVHGAPMLHSALMMQGAQMVSGVPMMMGAPIIHAAPMIMGVPMTQGAQVMPGAQIMPGVPFMQGQRYIQGQPVQDQHSAPGHDEPSVSERQTFDQAHTTSHTQPSGASQSFSHSRGRGRGRGDSQTQFGSRRGRGRAYGQIYPFTGQPTARGRGRLQSNDQDSQFTQHGLCRGYGKGAARHNFSDRRPGSPVSGKPPRGRGRTISAPQYQSAPDQSQQRQEPFVSQHPREQQQQPKHLHQKQPQQHSQRVPHSTHRDWQTKQAMATRPQNKELATDSQWSSRRQELEIRETQSRINRPRQTRMQTRETSQTHVSGENQAVPSAEEQELNRDNERRQTWQQGDHRRSQREQRQNNQSKKQQDLLQECPLPQQWPLPEDVNETEGATGQSPDDKRKKNDLDPIQREVEKELEDIEKEIYEFDLLCQTPDEWAQSLREELKPIVTRFGTVELRLKKGIKMEFTVDSAIKIINSKGGVMISLNSTKNEAVIKTDKISLHQMNINIDVTLEDGAYRRFVKTRDKGVSFAGRASGLAYIVDAAGVRSSIQKFSDVSDDDLVSDVFSKNSLCGEQSMLAAGGMVFNTRAWTKDDINYWNINQFSITQLPDGLVTILYKGKVYLTSSPSRGYTKVQTPFFTMTLSSEHMHLIRGKMRVYSNGTLLSIKHEGHSTGLDMENDVFIEN